MTLCLLGSTQLWHYNYIFQLKDICEVTAVVAEHNTKSENDENDCQVTVESFNQAVLNDIPCVPSNENDANQLISFGGNTGTDEKLDGLSLDDLNGKQSIIKKLSRFLGVLFVHQLKMFFLTNTTFSFW